MNATAADFLAACLATCAAEVLTLPADTLKVRMQIWGRDATMSAAVRRMFSENGIAAFFSGLDVAVLRQASYGTLKYGLYPVIVSLLWSMYPESSQISVKIMAGLLAGTVSSAVCNPTDLLKTRRQGSAMTGKSILQGFQQIADEEGVVSLWTTGLLPNVLRAGVLTAAELATFDACRPAVAAYTQSEVLTPIISALLASVCSTIVSCPFDTIKSRMMNQLKDVKEKKSKYTSTLDCVRKSIHSEGLLVLWSGVLAYFLRLVPNTILTLFFLEKIRILISFFVVK